MKKLVLILLGLALTAAVSAQETRVFAMASTGDVSFELADRIRTYLEAQTGAAVRMIDPVPLLPGGTLEEIGRYAARNLKPDEFGLIILARPDTDQPQGVCLPHERFGILNLNRLGEGADEDRLVRRAGQDGLRVMSMLLDMSPCPFPLCVLTGFEKTDDLDRMSGNYCPPCQDRFTRLARRADLQLIEKPVPAAAPPPAEEAPAAAEPPPAEPE